MRTISVGHRASHNVGYTRVICAVHRVMWKKLKSKVYYYNYANL